VGLDDLRQERRNSRVQLLAFGQRALEHGGDVVERFGHRRVERGVRERDVLTRRDRAELELVAREGERAPRLRSPASRGSFGSTLTPTSSIPPCLVDVAPPFSICSKMSVSMSEAKTSTALAGRAAARPSLIDQSRILFAASNSATDPTSAHPFVGEGWSPAGGLPCRPRSWRGDVAADNARKRRITKTQTFLADRLCVD